MKRSFTGILILLVLMIPAFAFSIETDAKDAFAMPAGLDAFIMYYRLFTANTKYVNGSVDNSTTYDSAKANIIIARAVHYGKFIGPSVYNINVLLPMGMQEVETRGGSTPVTGNFKQTASGIGDMTLQAAVFTPLWGKTAPSGHLGFPDQLDFTIAEYITFPTGEYRESRLINMGDRRYACTSQMALGLRLGNLWLSVVGDIEFFTDNRDFDPSLVAGLPEGSLNKVDLKKDTQYSYQGHIAYDFSKTIELGVSAIHVSGGNTHFDGTQLGLTDYVNLTGNQGETYLKFGAGFMLSPNFQLLLQYRQDIENKNGYRFSGPQGRLSYLF